MSLSKLIEDKYKRYLNVRVNNLTIDGNMNLAPQSVPISSLQSTGSVGFLHDDSIEIVRKNIEITDLQNIGSSAADNSYLRHDNGSVSFQPINTDVVTIYNNDDSLTGNRIVDGGTNTLTFNNLSSLTLDATNLTFNSIPNDNTDNRLISIDSGTNKISYREVSSLPVPPSGNTIYNANDSLTSNRTITGNNFNLDFTGVKIFDITSTALNLRPTELFFNTITNDNTDTRLVSVDSITNKVSYRDLNTITGTLNAYANYQINPASIPFSFPNAGINNVAVLQSTISNNFSLITNTTIRPTLTGIYKLDVFISSSLSMNTAFRFTMKNASFTFAQCIVTNVSSGTQTKNITMTKIINLGGVSPANDIVMEVERTSGVGTYVLQDVNSFSINLIRIG